MSHESSGTAVVQVSSAPSRALYEAVTAAVDFEGQGTQGLIAHAAADLPDGTVLIVDVWSDEASMDAFEHSRLLPAFASVPGDGITTTSRPVRHPAFHLVAR